MLVLVTISEGQDRPLTFLRFTGKLLQSFLYHFKGFPSGSCNVYRPVASIEAAEAVAYVEQFRCGKNRK